MRRSNTSFKPAFYGRYFPRRRLAITLEINVPYFHFVSSESFPRIKIGPSSLFFIRTRIYADRIAKWPSNPNVKSDGCTRYLPQSSTRNHSSNYNGLALLFLCIKKKVAQKTTFALGERSPESPELEHARSTPFLPRELCPRVCAAQVFPSFTG